MSFSRDQVENDRQLSSSDPGHQNGGKLLPVYDSVLKTTVEYTGSMTESTDRQATVNYSVPQDFRLPPVSDVDATTTALTTLGGGRVVARRSNRIQKEVSY